MKRIITLVLAFAMLAALLLPAAASSVTYTVTTSDGCTYSFLHQPCYMIEFEDVDDGTPFYVYVIDDGNTVTPTTKLSDGDTPMIVGNLYYLSSDDEGYYEDYNPDTFEIQGSSYTLGGDDLFCVADLYTISKTDCEQEDWEQICEGITIAHIDAVTNISYLSSDNPYREKVTYIDGTFTDVASDHWGKSNIVNAYELGLMKGTSAATFDPNGKITIAQAIALAARLHSLYYNHTDNFTQGEIWYQCYVDYAKENDIPTNFAYYNAYATRSQFASILAAALPEEALGIRNSVEDGSIPDVRMTYINADDIYMLYRAGILTGSDELGTFNPNSNITRAEAAAIITRMADPSLRKSITLGSSSDYPLWTVSIAAD